MSMNVSVTDNFEPSRDPAPNSGRVRYRRGYTLVLVLGLTTVMSALGLTYLDTTSTVMPEAVNHLGAVRAKYLAGSGVAMGTHFLMYPQTTVPYGQYWTGGSNIAVDATTDYVNVTVVRSDAWSPPQNDPNRYQITATGVAKSFDGSIRAKNTVTADVMVPRTGQWEMTQGLVLTNTGTMAAQVRVYGDMHTNGILTAFGWCQSKVSGTGLVTWLGSGPPSSIVALADAVTTPSATASRYTNYTIQGKSYSAYTSYAKSEMTSADAVALNAIDMSATNPGRIIMAPSGNFALRAGVSLKGTLVVSGGSLQIADAGSYAILAENNFPALIVGSSGIRVLSNSATFDVTGSVISSGGLDVNSAKSFTMNVSGAAIFRDGPGGFHATSVCNFTWNAARATFWDFDGVVQPKPITVLSWKEQ
jgi:hypothetical protein